MPLSNSNQTWNAAHSEERAKFWRDPALNNLEMLRATYVTHTFSRHTHEGYAIGVIEAGVEEFTYQGAAHSAPAGSVVIIHPGEVHTGNAGTPAGWTYQMVMMYADDRPYLAPVGQEHSVVQRIQDYLMANYADTISLEQLADIANLKPLRLLRMFRKEVGLPHNVYLVQVRVTRAKVLLSMAVPIAQVAADTGCTDQSHLTRHFKRLVGVTPRQYALGCCKNVQDLLL